VGSIVNLLGKEQAGLNEQKNERSEVDKRDYGTLTGETPHGETRRPLCGMKSTNPT